MMILGSYIKQPADALDYDISYADFLNDADAIEPDAVVTTIDKTGLTHIRTDVIGGNRLKIWLSGGVHGTTYKVTVTVTTIDGRIKQDEFNIRIREY